MTYQERISSIQNLSMDEIITNCKAHIPENHRRHPYYHPELNHGLDLLNSEEALDCYMGAYGEMHKVKCRAAFQNIPFPPSGANPISLALEIYDWGCGQGIGSICLIDFLKQRDLTKWLKKVTLIEPSNPALNRALLNVSNATNNRVRINKINSYLPSKSSNPEISIHFEHHYVFHIFSNILDVEQIELSKLARMLAIPGHTHYILCMGPMNANSFRIDRFAEMFNPYEYFSNISNPNYSQTTDTNHRFGCKTKSFIYQGHSLDFSHYDPNEIAGRPIYNDYDVNLQIENGLMSYGKAWVYYRLQNILAPNDLIYLDPDINGAKPDFILVRPNIGVMNISIFEENLSNCKYDSDKKNIIVNNVTGNQDPKELQSPLDALSYYQSLIIENVKELTDAIIDNNRNLGLIKKVLICTNGSTNQAKELFANPNYSVILGNEFISDENISKSLFNISNFYYHSPIFDDTVLNRLKRDLSPKWHSYREGFNVTLTREQAELAISIEGAQRKISGVVGSGKTQVLATRAVNAQVRTGGDVLILTFNITLANYLRMRLSQIRADFPWDKIHIDYYHRFFRKYASVNNRHVHFGSYNNEDFFEDASSKYQKFDAIFIDEVQDFETPWLKVLIKHFLKDNGEFVVFGDPKQNIYNRPIDNNGDIKLGVIRSEWNHTLDRSMRFSNPALSELAIKFQKTFYGNADMTGYPYNAAHQNEFQFNIMKYKQINATDTSEDLAERVYNICKTFIDENDLDVSEVAIIGPQSEILRKIEYLYRMQTRKRTTVTFVRKEGIDRISRQTSQASYGYKQDLDRLEKVNKNRFTMQTRHLKLSTIQSFKGWEAKTIICIIQEDSDNDDNLRMSPQLVYTGITRAQENLFVINIGNNAYDEFFKINLQ